MKSFIKTFLKDESGASAAEYALILAIVGATIVVGALFLGQAIGGAMNTAGECINAGAACEAPAAPPPAGG